MGLSIIRGSRSETHPFVVIADHSEWNRWSYLSVIVTTLRYEYGSTSRFFCQRLTLTRTLLIIITTYLNVIISTLDVSLSIRTITVRYLTFRGNSLSWLSLASGILVAGIAALETLVRSLVESLRRDYFPDVSCHFTDSLDFLKIDFSFSGRHLFSNYAGGFDRKLIFRSTIAILQIYLRHAQFIVLRGLRFFITKVVLMAILSGW